MADQKDGRSHNQPPSRDEAAKGGQHSHEGNSEKSQPDQGQGGQRQPTTDGQHSHEGNKK